MCHCGDTNGKGRIKMKEQEKYKVIKELVYLNGNKVIIIIKNYI